MKPTATELLTKTGHESTGCTAAADYPKAGDVAIIGYVPYTETDGAFTKEDRTLLLSAVLHKLVQS